MSDAWFDFDLLESGGFSLQSFGEGEKIFLAGDEGAEMFVVKSGKVHIIASGVVVEHIGPQGIFGEMAMIDGSPRSATAVAVEETEIAPVDRSTFLYMVKQNPEFALQVLQMLTVRIRQMNEYI
jgi:CRP/FNR family transcriptional regulator, cyclic AMP receptor protein